MVRFGRWHGLVWIAWAATSAAWAHADPPSLHLAYRLSPVLEDGSLRALSITVAFNLPLEGRLRWHPPQGLSARDASPFASTPTVRGAAFEQMANGTWIVRGAAGAHATMTYAVRPAAGPGVVDGSVYRGAWIGDSQFEALGNDVFAVPSDQDDAPVTFDWRAPSGWSLAATLSTFAPDARTATHLRQSSFVGGRKLVTVTRPIRGGTLRMSSVGAAMALSPLADAMVPVVNGLRAFWADTRGDFVVTVLAMPPGKHALTGIGRDGGFMGQMAADTPPQRVAWLTTHEYTHAWIPGRTGRMPTGDGEPSAYWFSEGFTVFYTDRASLRDGRASLRDFQDDFNATAVGYDMSPVRRASNARIVRDFWTDPAVQQLPYVRGAMLAYLLDARLVGRTAGTRSLDHVLRRMRDRFAADPQLGVRENLAHSYAELGGGDIRDWLVRYIDRGEPMALPDDLFGGCLTILRENKPGFGRVQSAVLVPGLSPARTDACMRRLGGVPESP